MTATRTLQFGVLLFSLIGLAGCAMNNNVVQKGMFQQRKYVRPGWFVQLPEREDQSDLTKEVSAEAEPASVPLTELSSPFLEPIEAIDDAALPIELAQDDDLSGSITADAGNGLPGILAGPLKLTSRIIGVDLQSASLTEAPAPQEGDGGRVNTFALLGFIFAFLVPVAGLVLSIIGLHQTRGGQRGHGLALAGLIISIVLILIYGAFIL